MEDFSFSTGERLNSESAGTACSQESAGLRLHTAVLFGSSCCLRTMTLPESGNTATGIHSAGVAETRGSSDAGPPDVHGLSPSGEAKFRRHSWQNAWRWLRTMMTRPTMAVRAKDILVPRTDCRSVNFTVVSNVVRQWPSRRGAGFIAARSEVSRQMEPGILLFPGEPAGFGIFNRTCDRKSAERITVHRACSRKRNTRCSFCRCDTKSSLREAVQRLLKHRLSAGILSQQFSTGPRTRCHSALTKPGTGTFPEDGSGFPGQFRSPARSCQMS